MFIEQLTLEGFLSYKEKQVIDFSNLSTCLVLGKINDDSDLSNGAGKSSLFESIPVCFFGKGSGRANVLDSYINDSMSKMFIEVIFKVDNQRYKVLRSRTRDGVSQFEVFFDSVNKEFSKIQWKKFDKTIEDIIGLSPKTYSSTIYLNERESLQIITGTSSERKEILRELLNIDIYESASKKCNKKFDDLEKKVLVNINLVQDRQKQIEQESELKEKLLITENSIKNIKTEQKKIEARLKTNSEEQKKFEIALESQAGISQQIKQQQVFINELVLENKELDQSFLDLNNEVEEQAKKYNLFKDKIEADIKRKPDLKKTIKGLNADLKKLDELEKEHEVLKAENTKLIEERMGITSAEKLIESEMKPINIFLEKLSTFENICPVTELECPVLTGNNKDELSNSKQKELKELEDKKQQCRKNYEIVQNKIVTVTDKITVLLKATVSRQRINNDLTSSKLDLQSIENNESKLEEKQKEFQNYLSSCIIEKEDIKKNKEKNSIKSKDLETKLEELKKKIDLELDLKLLKAKKIVSESERELEGNKQQLDSHNQKLGEIKNSIAHLETLRKDIEHMLKTNEEWNKKKALYQTLSTIFGKDGIQKSLMKESIPLLENFTSEYLKIFNNDSEKIKVKFDLDPKKQDGEYKKGGGLEILVIEEGKDPKDLQMYSGGETVRIVFSIVLSLAKLLTMRAGKKLETLIIDEKVAKLDSRGIEQFGEVIQEISKIYRQVFVITHIESLKDMINGNQIIVNKTEEEGSLVTVS